MNHSKDYRALLDYASKQKELAERTFSYCRINIGMSAYVPRDLLLCDLSRPVLLIEDCNRSYVVSSTISGKIVHASINTKAITIVERLFLPIEDEYFLNNL